MPSRNRNNASATGIPSSSTAAPMSTYTVPRRFSFAMRPVMEATVSSQCSPKPQGRNIPYTAPPMSARMESLMFVSPT